MKPLKGGDCVSNEKEVLKARHTCSRPTDQTQDSLDSVETQDQVSSETLDQAIEEAKTKSVN